MATKRLTVNDAMAAIAKLAEQQAALMAALQGAPAPKGAAKATEVVKVAKTPKAILDEAVAKLAKRIAKGDKPRTIKVTSDLHNKSGKLAGRLVLDSGNILHIITPTAEVAKSVKNWNAILAVMADFAKAYVPIRDGIANDESKAA